MIVGRVYIYVDIHEYDYNDYSTDYDNDNELWFFLNIYTIQNRITPYISNNTCNLLTIMININNGSSKYKHSV